MKEGELVGGDATLPLSAAMLNQAASRECACQQLWELQNPTGPWVACWSPCGWGPGHSITFIPSTYDKETQMTQTTCPRPTGSEGQHGICTLSTCDVHPGLGWTAGGPEPSREAEPSRTPAQAPPTLDAHAPLRASAPNCCRSA